MYCSSPATRRGSVARAIHFSPAFSYTMVWYIPVLWAENLKRRPSSDLYFLVQFLVLLQPLQRVETSNLRKKHENTVQQEREAQYTHTHTHAHIHTHTHTHTHAWIKVAVRFDEAFRTVLRGHGNNTEIMKGHHALYSVLKINCCRKVRDVEIGQCQNFQSSQGTHAGTTARHPH